MKANPILQIKKDLKELAQLTIDCATSLPEDKMQVDIERKVRRILKTYRMKVKEQPNYRATTK
jgi:hypothetical protein